MHEVKLPKLLTVKQTAELLQVSTKTIYRWINASVWRRSWGLRYSFFRVTLRI
jgi:predicted DNA-binding transcriptional regulator AlpA